MRTRIGLVFGTTLAAALIFGACGGGEEATPTPATRPTAVPAPTVTRGAAEPTTTRPPSSTVTVAPAPSPTPTARPAATSTPSSSAPTGKLIAAAGSFGNEVVDPSVGSSAGNNAYGSPFWDYLLWNNAEGDLLPGVLVKWEMAPDAKLWTLTLRPDMKFHNGDPVTAEDLAFSIMRVSRPEASSGFGTIWKTSVDRVEVVSPTVARLYTKLPWPLFPLSSSPRGGAEGVVLPSAYFKQVGEAGYRNKPLGSGPWRFVRHDLNIGFAYEAAPGKHPFREQPSFKELSILLVPEETTRTAMLKTGAANIVETSFDTAATLPRTQFSVVQVPNVTYAIAMFNGLDDPRMDQMPMGKRDVRKAVQLAINKQEIVDTILYGQAEVPARWLVAPGVLGYDPSWKPDPHNPAEAKRLLTAAGYPNGFTIQLTTGPAPGVTYLPKIAEAVSGYWSAIGVRTQIQLTDYGNIGIMWRRRPQPDQIVGGAVTSWSPVQSSPLSLFQATYFTRGVSLLMQRKSMDDLILAAAAEIDDAKRTQLIRQVVDVAYQEYIVAPIALAPALFATTVNLEGWQRVRSAAYIGLTLETVRLKR